MKSIVWTATVALCLTFLPAPSAMGYEVVDVQNGGRISGSIRFKGTPPSPKPLKVTKNENVCGVKPLFSQEFVVSTDGGFANVVLSLVDIDKGKDFPKGTPRVVQDQCMFVPHVALIPVGKNWKLVNDDKILHNLRTLSKQNTPLNIAHPKFKKTLNIKKKFSKPEIMRINCDVHNWMDGWIVATAHPYYAVSKESGQFSLTDVPPGTYKIQAWHEVLGTQVKTVTVPAGGEVKVDFAFER